MYLATSIRPDSAFVVGQLSRFVAQPHTKCIGTLKRALRYVAGTLRNGITYARQNYDMMNDNTMHILIEVYCDSDWANDPEQRKSTTGYVFTLADGAAAWMSRRQPIIALSTAEAEYVAACEASMEAMAEYNILRDILPTQCQIKLRIVIDNQAAYIMATSQTYSRRARHIELRWHYVREQVQKCVIDRHKVKGENNPADMFTKPLDKKRLLKLMRLTGVGDQV